MFVGSIPSLTANFSHLEGVSVSAKWLKDMWKNGDFTELGAYLGQKLRDALNSIPWGKIQNTARKIASSLATLLNGFFRTEMARS